LVVQVNKQDVEGARSLKALRRDLGLEADVPMIGASAVSGKGVRRTLTAAMRLGVLSVQGGDEVAPQLPALADPDALFDHVLAFEDTPVDESPIEVEELNLNAPEAEVDDAVAEGHLQVSPLDALEERARRAAQKRRETATPASGSQKAG
jgi:hypothetical protein